MHWINFHIKAHCCFSMQYNTSCSLDHEKELSRNFSPYMQKCNSEWNMSIMGWVCGFLSHLSKSSCVRKLESCARFSPFRGVCLVVELTGLG